MINENEVSKMYNILLLRRDELSKKYPDTIIQNIGVIADKMKTKLLNNNESVGDELSELQNINDRLYNLYSDSIEVIKFQATINGIRHWLDTPDNNELIYSYPDGNFVQ